jgi:hypothetical protein
MAMWSVPEITVTFSLALWKWDRVVTRDLHAVGEGTRLARIAVDDGHARLARQGGGLNPRQPVERNDPMSWLDALLRSA